MSAWSEEEYKENMRKKVEECYRIGIEARSRGRDVTDRVEIPLANDMADRVEELLGIRGISREIRDLAEKMSREEVSLEMAKRIASKFSKDGKEVALDRAIRTGLAILTEGILVAPLEGISQVKIGKNHDGTDYVSIVYAGPIRGAGGTAQAMSVLIGDIVRRELDIGKFKATEDEIERYIEEIQAYNRVKHLQYLPDSDEIRRVMVNCPVCIDGEGSEDEEISGHRDMERIKTNKIRGGMCLVLCEGLLQKSKKVLKHTAALGIDDWNFLSESGRGGGSSSGDRKAMKFLSDLVAGRPVFSHPNRPGGFRLRYGRSRLSGLAAASIHPATMYVLRDFIATGSQIKVEMPGKAAAITPCDEIEGPMVLLDDGRHITVRSEEEAKEVREHIIEITDLGEILFSYGDFLENNHVLEKTPFSVEYWNLLAENRGVPDDLKKPETARQAFDLSLKYSVPLHPNYNYFWHDLTLEEADWFGKYMREEIESGRYPEITEGTQVKDVLVRLGVEFSSGNGTIRLDDHGILEHMFRSYEKAEFEGNTVDYLSRITGVEIKERSPVRVGARLGRPEKAGDRKMKPKVHALFPIENTGGARRSILDAASKTDGNYTVEINLRECLECHTVSAEIICPSCGGRTKSLENFKRIDMNMRDILERSISRLNLDMKDLKEFKGVKKLMSRGKYAEPLEKGILRAYHDISVNKDGTCRYDMSDVPVTHFLTGEIRLPDTKASEIGYVPGMNEIFTQDIIIPWDSAEYLLRVSKFVDDLLVKYYDMEPYYECQNPEDLIGHIVIGLAPHTSGGIAGRIIGFSSMNAGYAHPFYHAAKRRNCDGDEDSIMLLMDGLLNFSRDFLPSTTGGLMDAPLVMTLLLKPDEVDKEALNVDSLKKYPLEFYLATERNAKPSEIESIMRPVKYLVEETGSARGIDFMFSTSDINGGVPLSSYKTLVTMGDKIRNQLELARTIRAVDENDVAGRLINSHFLPDMFGNFRGFFSQEFRCTKCNAKFRRVPLSGKCYKCGQNSLTLTIHRGGIVKYMEETRKILENFNLEDALRYRVENLFRTIDSSFNFPEKEKEEANSLDLFQEEEEIEA
ncbi:MAG: DNA polymerase II large subunit [Candidatus Thermoplasmatota archaeon]|jgi:DNA polymerase II large subunit|nr:DNA polymerase II large subunit [Candidatus Thermoplasmatota archaeon]